MVLCYLAIILLFLWRLCSDILCALCQICRLELAMVIRLIFSFRLQQSVTFVVDTWSFTPECAV